MKKFNNAVVNLAVNSGAAETALRARRSKPVVLMYHGVSIDIPQLKKKENNLENCEEKHISPNVFADDLKTLKKCYSIKIILSVLNPDKWLASVVYLLKIKNNKS